jgi:hypothetical protein
MPKIFGEIIYTMLKAKEQAFVTHSGGLCLSGAERRCSNEYKKGSKIVDKSK